MGSSPTTHTKILENYIHIGLRSISVLVFKVFYFILSAKLRPRSEDLGLFVYNIYSSISMIIKTQEMDIENKFTTSHLILKHSELKELIKRCKESKIVAVDFETNGRPLFMNDFTPTILAVTFKAGFSSIIPLMHNDERLAFLNKESNLWLEWLKEFGEGVIENPSITKIGWNWKFDNQIFNKYGIYSRGAVIDGMLAKHLLDEEKPMGLKQMVSRYIPEFDGYDSYDEFDSIAWDKKPLMDLVKYAGIDSDMEFRLGLFFEAKLMSKGFYKLYRNLVMPASNVLQSAEKHGLPFDVALNASLNEKYSSKIEEITNNLKSIRAVKRFQRHINQERKEKYIKTLEDEIKELSKDKEANIRKIKSREAKISRVVAGELVTKDEQKIIEPFNFGSVAQLNNFLFLHPNGLQLTATKMTEKGAPSTSEDALTDLLPNDESGFISNLLELRGISTIYSTFIKGLGQLVQDDGRVHPRYLLHGTTSGRLSSRDPNGQNIPKTSVNPDIKLQFLPPKGKLFLAYDYSQAELRILAHLANEDSMLSWFRDGRDIHLASACKKYGEDYDEILKIYENEQHPEYKKWKVRRKEAKTINFGVVYEQTAGKLAESLTTPEHTVTKEEGQKFLDDFFDTFPKIKQFVDTQHALMEKQGYITSLFGRKRRCPGVFSSDYSIYLAALRQSTNMPCQSAASDMALFASVIVYENVKTGKLPPMQEVNTVHDSVYQFIDPKYITPDLIYKVWDICRNPSTKEFFGFTIDDVDMSMDFTIGRTMAEELPYIPGYDYNKLLRSDFNIDDYYVEYNKFKHIAIPEYPKKFKKYFEESWRERK